MLVLVVWASLPFYEVNYTESNSIGHIVRMFGQEDCRHTPYPNVLLLHWILIYHVLKLLLKVWKSFLKNVNITSILDT